jgi:hypothetical protein
LFEAIQAKQVAIANTNFMGREDGFIGSSWRRMSLSLTAQPGRYHRLYKIRKDEGGKDGR